MLRDKKFVIGVTGSIAAYKTAILVRLLKKEGAEVKVVMTPAAKQFITPLTLSTLSGNPVLSDFFQGDTGTWNSHVAPWSVGRLHVSGSGKCEHHGKICPWNMRQFVVCCLFVGALPGFHRSGHRSSICTTIRPRKATWKYCSKMAIP